MKRKRISALILSAVIASASLAACGGASDSAPGGNAPDVTTNEAAVTEAETELDSLQARALVSDDVPVVVVAPSDSLFDKTVSNMQEVLARGGKVVFFGDAEGMASVKDRSAAAIVLPKVDPFVAPILYAIPVQLLAYHTAVAKGTDVDQPRNLAKSVTVE